MILKVEVFVFLLFWFCHEGKAYSDCGSEVGTLTSIEISGCQADEERCIFKRGDNATIKIDFNSEENTDELTAVVHGIIMGVPVAFPVPNPDGCVNSGISCPIRDGSSYVYQATLPILKKYPRVTLDVKWELQDEEGKDIVCGLIPIKIQ